MNKMTSNRTAADLRFMQLALNTSDIAATLRLYSEAFGFANSGSQTAWGDIIAIQGLDPSARTLLWWMVGRQEFAQLEIFHHTSPAQRPQPSDWRPCDHGWVRFGISVPDFDATLAVLARWDIVLITAPRDTGHGRRAAFRDPFVGVIVEVMEEHPDMPGGIRRKHFDLDPAIIYLTSSVADIAAARHFYGEQLQLEVTELDRLHTPDAEALWGLPGIKREGFLVRAGDAFLEVIEYLDPVGKPLPDDYRLSDQGIMNIGLATEDPARIQAIIDRLDSQGMGPQRMMVGPDFLGTYLLDRGREVELLACPRSFAGALGFEPGAKFFGEPTKEPALIKLQERSGTVNPDHMN